jgi:predicted RNA binding protein YcfA (HicA-like mRNA interferase family)
MGSFETNRNAVVRRLVREGWVLERSGGAHDIYVHPDQPGVLVIPRHRTLSPGVARAIAKQVGWI